jgi:putative peptide zinc metalloprotease protein
VAIERPTFHESWYRVAELHPRLRSTVQISRQHFRGQPWHVVQDHTNNAFFRLAEPAYRFIGLLDGKRSVADAWKYVSDQLGDDAPTQGEVIQLLGQLYTSNLLQAEVPADTHTLFARYKKRKSREITGYLMNIMFARLPLIDPDAFLERWIKLLGWIFSPVGLIVWVALIAAGFYAIAEVPNWQGQLVDGAQGLLSPQNLILLYVAFAFIKAFHEMGHAISCKKFGKQSGTGGEVHIIGIMFLVFTPVPYVDASSSWALRNKWHRAIVGAAGMWVELGIAAIAAMVWARTGTTGQYAWVHAFAYNVMFVASFSTIVFNANPLLRYDGYYMLSDLLEIPNLGQRANEFIYYLVKRYIWNVRFARNPAYSRSEEFWLFTYCIASFLMRVIVSVSIMFYLATVLEGALILLAAGMAIAGIITWVCVPIGKFLHYLVTNPELSRVRTRAILTTAIFSAAVLTAVGAIPLPDRARAQGVVEPLNMQELFAGNDGFVDYLNPYITRRHIAPGLPGVTSSKPNNPTTQTASTQPAATLPTEVLAFPIIHKDDLIVAATNPELDSKKAELLAERQRLVIRRNMAFAEEIGKAQLVQGQIDSMDEQIANINEQLRDLQLKAPLDGVLVAPEMETKRHAYLRRGDHIGLVASLDNLIIRAAAANDLGGPLETEASRRVEIRVEGRPDILLTGRIAAKVPAGSNQLPSAALGYQMGGEFNTSPEDRQGTKTTENFFEVRIDHITLEKAPRDVLAKSKETGRLPLLPGQRVIVRFDLAKKPLAEQAWTAVLQLFQRKFQM